MADFSPENRNSAIWSGDARRMVAGRQGEVWLEKTGQKEIADIGHLEPVQWGLRLQEPIARAVGDRLDIRLKELDIEGTHIQHKWMRSHFDFVSEDNKTLYEIKNYNANARNKFGEDGSTNVPVGDLAQCIHEAAVFGVDRVVLCVLFGGQELCLFDLPIEESSKEVLIQQEAALWAHVQTKTPPELDHPDDLRAVFKRDDGSYKVASREVEAACIKLKDIKTTIKRLEEQEELLTGMVMNHMGEASLIQTVDGHSLATWKAAKASMRFDSKEFERSLPETYAKYVREVPGSRRFLVK